MWRKRWDGFARIGSIKSVAYEVMMCHQICHTMCHMPSEFVFIRNFYWLAEVENRAKKDLIRPLEYFSNSKIILRSWGNRWRLNSYASRVVNSPARAFLRKMNELCKRRKSAVSVADFFRSQHMIVSHIIVHGRDCIRSTSTPAPNNSDQLPQL
jgi:hypothetical protein